MKRCPHVAIVTTGTFLLGTFQLLCTGCAETQPALLATPAGELPITALPSRHPPKMMTTRQLFWTFFEMARIHWHCNYHLPGGSGPLPRNSLLYNIVGSPRRQAITLYTRPGHFTLHRRPGKPSFANHHLRIVLPPGWRCLEIRQDANRSPTSYYWVNLLVMPRTGRRFKFGIRFSQPAKVPQWVRRRLLRYRSEFLRYCQLAGIKPRTELAAELAAEYATPFDLYKDAMNTSPLAPGGVAEALQRTFLRLEFKRGAAWTRPVCIAASRSLTIAIQQVYHPPRMIDVLKGFSRNGRFLFMGSCKFLKPTSTATRLREELSFLSGLDVFPARNGQGGGSRRGIGGAGTPKN